MKHEFIDDEYERALEQMVEAHTCPYVPKCDQPQLDQCYNHSHVLCDQFKDFYRQPKSI